MPLDPVKVQIADIVVSRFLDLKQPTSRKTLLIEVRDGAVLDEMESRTLLRAENDRRSYFPTLGTFVLLGDEDARLAKARLVTLPVLRTLTKLYEVNDSDHSYTAEELIEHVRAKYNAFASEEIRLGLYLAVSEFGAIQTYRLSDDGTEILSFRIAEGVLKIQSPEDAWTRRVVISRNNGSVSEASFQTINDLVSPNEVTVLQKPNSWIEPQPQRLTTLAEQLTPSEGSPHPKVFISYAWESEELQDWVRAFATRLRENGVDVTLDQWHLQYGDDRLQFMERSVASAAFVLIICTPAYAEKANDRTGGVGYESNILTSRIVEKMAKQKFIPLLRSGTWATSLPTWAKHLISCDFSDEPYAEAQFVKLLKQMHGKALTIPAIGPVPSFD